MSFGGGAEQHVPLIRMLQESNITCKMRIIPSTRTTLQSFVELIHVRNIEF